MLVITGRIGEKLFIGDSIELTILCVAGSRTDLGIIVPKNIAIAPKVIQKSQAASLEESALVVGSKPNKKRISILQRQRLRRIKHIKKG